MEGVEQAWRACHLQADEGESLGGVGGLGGGAGGAGCIGGDRTVGS